MLDPRADKAIGQLTQAIRAVFGSDLVSLILYGSAASDEFIPGHSDLNCAIVLERVGFDHLRSLHQHLPGWHDLGMAVPLLIDRDFLTSAGDVFPMELLDIKAQHRVLYGEEVIATLPIDARNLRYQCEHEARSKLLRLRALYAEVGAEAQRLHALMLDSVKTFLVIMRSFLRLRVDRVPAGYAPVLARFCDEFGIQFPIIQLLVHVRAGDEPWPKDIDGVFAGYLDEVERLVRLIDRLQPTDLNPVRQQL